MTTIYKYPFEICDVFTLMMPKGAEILSVQMQGDVPTLWALVNPQTERETRGFAIYGTGHAIPLPEQLRHISTLQQGSFVWHLFEVL